MSHSTNVLGIDYGGARIGIARVNAFAKIPQPLGAIKNGPSTLTELAATITQHDVSVLVVGLPRSLNGEDTDQTREVYEFAKLLEPLKLPVYFQDEALTSSQAKTELNKAKKQFSKSDVDSLSAVYILEDFVKTIKV